MCDEVEEEKKIYRLISNNLMNWFLAVRIVSRILIESLYEISLLITFA